MSKFNAEEDKFIERQKRLQTIHQNLMAKCDGDDSNCTTGPLIMSEREEWINLIRNEYDPAPAHYRMGEDWDDGAGRIADAILADRTLLDRHDRYGLALMMISQGCADPVGVATKTLAKGWHCKACGWQGEMPNTKIIPDAMGTAQVPCCPDCDQHVSLLRSPQEKAGS